MARTEFIRDGDNQLRPRQCFKETTDAVHGGPNLIWPSEVEFVALGVAVDGMSIEDENWEARGKVLSRNAYDPRMSRSDCP